MKKRRRKIYSVQNICGTSLSAPRGDFKISKKSYVEHKHLDVFSIPRGKMHQNLISIYAWSSTNSTLRFIGSLLMGDPAFFNEKRYRLEHNHSGEQTGRPACQMPIRTLLRVGRTLPESLALVIIA